MSLEDHAALSTNADILPTILNWAGVPNDKLESIFSGKSIFASSKRKFAWLSGASFPAEGREAAVVGSGFKIHLNFPDPSLSTPQVTKTMRWTDQELTITPQTEIEARNLLEESKRDLLRFLDDESEAGHR